MAALRFILVVAFAAYAAEALSLGLNSVGSGAKLGLSAQVDSQVSNAASLGVEAKSSIADAKNKIAEAQSEVSLQVESKLKANSAISNAIEKLKQIVQDLVDRAKAAEKKVEEYISNASSTAINSFNNLIKEKTGIDLAEKEAELKAKFDSCVAQLKPEFATAITDLKNSAEQCAATQVQEVEDIRASLQKVMETLKTVPEGAYEKIEGCSSSSSDDNKNDSDNGNKDENKLTLGFSLVSFDWDEVLCVSKVISNAAKDLSSLPGEVVTIVEKARDLVTAESKAQIATCAVSSLAVSEKDLQNASADLAECVLRASD